MFFPSTARPERVSPSYLQYRPKDRIKHQRQEKDRHLVGSFTSQEGFFHFLLFQVGFPDILIYHPSFSSPLDHPPSPLMSSIVKYVRGVDLNGADFKVTSLEFFFARHLSAPNATHRTYIYKCYKNVSFFLLCIFFDDVVRATKTIRVRASCMSLLPRTFAFRATICGPAVRRCAALLLYS